MKRGWIASAALLALAGSTAGAQKSEIKYYSEGKEREPIAALHGKPAFELQDLKWVQGGPVKLADLKGKVVLLDFFAQW